MVEISTPLSILYHVYLGTVFIFLNHYFINSKHFMSYLMRPVRVSLAAIECASDLNESANGRCIAASGSGRLESSARSPSPVRSAALSATLNTLYSRTSQTRTPLTRRKWKSYVSPHIQHSHPTTFYTGLRSCARSVLEMAAGSSLCITKNLWPFQFMIFLSSFIKEILLYRKS